MRTSVIVIGAAATALVAAAVSSTIPVAKGADKLKVGFIYLGPIGDFGWTYQHEVGRQGARQGHGRQDRDDLSRERQRRSRCRALDRAARAHRPQAHLHDLVRLYGPDDCVAKKFPKVDFEHATGYKREKNVATYSGRFYEGRYIQGQIAAKMSKGGVLGYIGSFPIPEVVSGINATMLGAQSINPNIKVKIIWVNTWFDPGKEADAAKALLDQGADVIMQHTDSPAAMQAAASRGAYAFGQDFDMIKFGPKAQLTAIVDNWAPITTSASRPSSPASGPRPTPGAA